MSDPLEISPAAVAKIKQWLRRSLERFPLWRRAMDVVAGNMTKKKYTVPHLAKAIADLQREDVDPDPRLDHMREQLEKYSPGIFRLVDPVGIVAVVHRDPDGREHRLEAPAMISSLQGFGDMVDDQFRQNVTELLRRLARNTTSGTAHGVVYHLEGSELLLEELRAVCWDLLNPKLAGDVVGDPVDSRLGGPCRKLQLREITRLFCAQLGALMSARNEPAGELRPMAEPSDVREMLRWTLENFDKIAASVPGRKGD